MRAIRSQGGVGFFWETSQMAYTINTTTAAEFFTNANAGTGPTAAQTLALQAIVNDFASGAISDDVAFGKIVNLAADTTTAVSVGAYEFFLGYAPSQAGLAALNAAYVGSGAQANLNGENRFIAQSVSLALQNATAKADFSAAYGSMSVEAATKAAYLIIIGQAAADANNVNVDNAVAFLASASAQAYYKAFIKANVPGIADADLDLAVKAAIVGEILFQATAYDSGAGIGSYAAATTNLLKDLADDGNLVGNNVAGIDLFAAYGQGNTGGKSFTLTTGVDSGTSFVGGAGADTFNGTTGTVTLTALDTLDGGAGVDTLNYIQTTAIAVPVSASIKNIEVVNLTSGADITVDASTWTGLTTLTASGTGGADITVASASVTAIDSDLAGNAIVIAGSTDATVNASKVTNGTVDVTDASGVVSVTTGLINGSAAGQITVDGGTKVTVVQNVKAAATATTGAVDITNEGDLTTVSVSATKGTGATVTYNTVAIHGVADADTDDTITTASISGYTTVGIDGANKLTKLDLAVGSGNVIIDNSAAGATDAATTLALGVNGLTGGTLDDADIYETLNVTTSGAASTLANITFGALETLTVAGDKKLTLTSLAGATSLTTIDAHTATGGLTIGSTLGTGVTYTGGTGVDTITLGATTKAIATGDGNDVVTLAAGTTALGTGGTIDAGAGTADVLSFADADDATTASAGTTFETKISNFEVVRLAGAAGAGVTVNLANLDDIKQVEVAVDLGQTLAVSGLGSGGKVTYNAAQTAASTITVVDAAAGTDDVVNIAISAAAARNVNTLTVANVETVNFLTDDTASTSTGIEHTASLTAGAAKTITVAGDAGLTLTFTGTSLETFDASGVTDGDVTWTAGATGDLTVKGGATADANVIVLSAVTGDVTYTGGSGTDTITMNNATNHDGSTNTFDLGNGTNTLTAGNNDGDNTVTGGTGIDTITVGNGDNTITTGSGNDVVTVGTGANTISLGAGNDTLTIGASAGLNTVDVGTGTDVVIFNGVQTAAGYYTSLTGMGAGDSIDLSANANDAGGLGAGVIGAKITLGGASSFANYLDAATAGDGSTDSSFHWFQYNGNTYIVLDNSAAATFQDGGDQVIELTGLVNLATATQDGSYVLTLA